MNLRFSSGYKDSKRRFSTDDQKMDVEDEGRMRRLYFDEEDDLEIMGLVIIEGPFKNSQRWTYIADVMKQRRRKHFNTKNVRDRVYRLINRFRARGRKLQFTSGKEERYDEMGQLLQQASDLKQEVDDNPSLKRRLNQKDNPGKILREEATVPRVTQMSDQQVVELLQQASDLKQEVDDNPSLKRRWNKKDNPGRILSEEAAVPRVTQMSDQQVAVEVDPNVVIRSATSVVAEPTHVHSSQGTAATSTNSVLLSSQTAGSSQPPSIKRPSLILTPEEISEVKDLAAAASYLTANRVPLPAKEARPPEDLICEHFGNFVSSYLLTLPTASVKKKIANIMRVLTEEEND